MIKAGTLAILLDVITMSQKLRSEIGKIFSITLGMLTIETFDHDSRYGFSMELVRMLNEEKDQREERNYQAVQALEKSNIQAGICRKKEVQ